jgi:hypothetical protein
VLHNKPPEVLLSPFYAQADAKSRKAGSRNKTEKRNKTESYPEHDFRNIKGGVYTGEDPCVYAS